MTLLLIIVLIFLLYNAQEGFRGRFGRFRVPRRGRRHLAEISTRAVSISRASTTRDVRSAIIKIRETISDLQKSMNEVKTSLHAYDSASGKSKLKIRGQLREGYDVLKNMIRELDEDVRMAEEAARAAEEIGSILSSEEANDVADEARTIMVEAEDMARALKKNLV